MNTDYITRTILFFATGRYAAAKIVQIGHRRWNYKNAYLFCGVSKSPIPFYLFKGEHFNDIAWNFRRIFFAWRNKITKSFFLKKVYFRKKVHFLRKFFFLNVGIPYMRRQSASKSYFKQPHHSLIYVATLFIGVWNDSTIHLASAATLGSIIFSMRELLMHRPQPQKSQNNLPAVSVDLIKNWSINQVLLKQLNLEKHCKKHKRSNNENNQEVLK